MRLNDILLEAGLSLSNLRKHNGRYFDTLISKINHGEALEVEPEYADRFPNGVVIDKSMIPMLMNAFYPGGKKDRAETDVSNSVIVVDPNVLRSPVKVAKSKELIPLGAITKTKDFKSGTGVNLGIIAEGVLGAALTAKFMRKGEEVTIVDLAKVLGKMDPQPVGAGSASVMGTFNAKVDSGGGVMDDLSFVLKLSKNEFSPLVGSIKDREKLDPRILGLIRSAMEYVNSPNNNISNAIKTIVARRGKNTIEVISDGISDARGTKADLRLRINGKVIKLISLKAVGVKQFGQISGYRYENFKNFVDDLFDIDISKYSSKFTLAGGPDAAKTNHDIITKIYRNELGPQITKQLGAGSKSEAKFIEKLTKGIIKHATGDADVDLVKFDRGLEGGYKVLKVDSNLLDKMRKVKFSVEVNPEKAVLKIFGQTSDPKLVKDLGTSEPVLLLQLRSQLQITAGYVRNILEMGDLLEELTVIERSKDKIQPTGKALKTAMDKRVGKITKKGERDVRDVKVPDVVALGRKKKK